MNTFTYTVTATPAAKGGTKTKSQSLTGSTNVTFSLSGLSAYDANPTHSYRMNKVVVDFDDGEELVITRPLSGTTIPSLTGNTAEPPQDKPAGNLETIDAAPRKCWLVQPCVCDAYAPLESPW